MSELLLQPHEERMIVESDELQEKITKLMAFLTTEPYSKLTKSNQELMMMQLGTMVDYYLILAKRISVFLGEK